MNNTSEQHNGASTETPNANDKSVSPFDPDKAREEIKAAKKKAYLEPFERKYVEGAKGGDREFGKKVLELLGEIYDKEHDPKAS